jgi:hypothetical protein
MFTRNRIKISERLLSLSWQRLLGRELTSLEGKRFKVIYPGRINNDSGPDFRDALIAIDSSELVRGDIEIHVKSSDWYSHGHHRDPEYNKVILHVVGCDDYGSATLLQSGKSIPLLSLSKELREQAWLMPHHRLPCFQVMNRMDEQALRKLLHAAGEERFKQKAILFQTGLSREEAGQALFRGMMRALGYAKNMEPFEDLANRVPLSFLEKPELSQSLLLKQAWLLGTAGLLSCRRLKGEARELGRIWQLVSQGAETMKESNWHFSHVYPNNSPLRRIIAQTYLLQRYHESGLFHGVLQLVREAPLLAANHALEEGLIVPGDGQEKVRKTALLGHSKASEIVVNVILPFTFSWGEICHEKELAEKALEIYLTYPRLSENEITRHMARQLCLEGSSDFTACHQQGLIHIYRTHCREGGCGECPLAG